MADPLVRETVELYALPPGEFTAARNARAKELKQKEPELAAAVAELPKPSVAAAALNALVREDPSEVRALVQSGKRLRDAQEAAVTGKKGPDLNAAVEEHRGALDRVQRDLRRRKLGDATLEKAIRTLRVASVDPELQPLLERGTLHEDLSASGFGLDPGLVPAKRKASARRPEADERDARSERRRAARERLEAARAALTEAKREARRAEAERKQAEARAAAAQRDVELAAESVEQAQQAVAEA